jgi:membrane-anchored glycerophosphoryl diester phosphodiesterase (GDPDase)
LLQLILGWFLFIIILFVGFIALIIPGVYLPNRLVFVLYAIAIENCSATEGLRRSWELTKGRWWLISRSSLLLSFVLFMPVVLVILLVDPTGKSMLAQIVSGVMGFLIGPFMGINFVLLYMRLKDRAANI